MGLINFKDKNGRNWLVSDSEEKNKTYRANGFADHSENIFYFEFDNGQRAYVTKEVFSKVWLKKDRKLYQNKT